jgi:hypothetical protein
LNYSKVPDPKLLHILQITDLLDKNRRDNYEPIGVTLFCTMPTIVAFFIFVLFFDSYAMRLKPLDLSSKSNEQLGLNELEPTTNEESFDQKLGKLDAKIHQRLHSQIGFVLESELCGTFLAHVFSDLLTTF